MSIRNGRTCVSCDSVWVSIVVMQPAAGWGRARLLPRRNAGSGRGCRDRTRPGTARSVRPDVEDDLLSLNLSVFDQVETGARSLRALPEWASGHRHGQREQRIAVVA